ncbi:MAG: ATP-dependent helicase [Anaerolineales bacterium]
MKLITGGPGSGKTQRLVDEIKSRLQAGVSPYMLLAATFSRQAAAEISERLGGDVAVRTVHGTAYWLIRLARRARGDRVPRVISEDESLVMMERAAQEIGAVFLEPQAVVQDMEHIRGRGGKFEALHPQAQEMIQRYFQILAAENLLDFTGILEAARQEIEAPDLRAFLQGMHLFVDEGQDLNPVTEWPILQTLLEGAEEFVMLASPSQQIYGFRGANWEKLVQHFPHDLTSEVMQRNYRSTPEIVNAVRPLAGPDASNMQAVRDSIGVPVRAVDALNPEMEADYVGRQVCEWIDRFQANGVPVDQIAVLTRVHSQHNLLQVAFRMRDLPFQTIGNGRGMFEREETNALLGYLRLAIDPMDDTVLETIVNFPPCGIGARIRYKLRGDDQLRWDHLIRVLADPEDWRPQVVRRVHRILDLRDLFDQLAERKLHLVDFVAKVADLSNIPDYLNSEGDFAGNRALRELIELGHEFGRPSEFIRYLEDEVARPVNSEGVQLATIHASKGREWKAVLLPGFNDGLLPLDAGDPGEEQNVAFVGLTRAKDQLVVTMSRPHPASPFLARLPLEMSRWP